MLTYLHWSSSGDWHTAPGASHLWWRSRHLACSMIFRKWYIAILACGSVFRGLFYCLRTESNPFSTPPTWATIVSLFQINVFIIKRCNTDYVIMVVFYIVNAIIGHTGTQALWGMLRWTFLMWERKCLMHSCWLPTGSKSKVRFTKELKALSKQLSWKERYRDNCTGARYFWSSYHILKVSCLKQIPIQFHTLILLLCVAILDALRALWQVPLVLFIITLVCILPEHYCWKYTSRFLVLLPDLKW